MTPARFMLLSALLAATTFGCASIDDSADGGSTALAPAGEQQMQLPPGWTEADMQACMAAGTPGEQHAFLAEGAGEWHGKSMMWMAPDTEPLKSVCTSTVTTMMDGRFLKTKMSGEMPGMGPFNGFGLAGFDNVSGNFVSCWIDNCGTGIMTGTGDLSADQKTLTWNFTYNCPVTGGPTKFREIQRFLDDDRMEMEMFMTDPKSGKEYRSMHIEFTRND